MGDLDWFCFETWQRGTFSLVFANSKAINLISGADILIIRLDSMPVPRCLRRPQSGRNYGPHKLVTRLSLWGVRSCPKPRVPRSRHPIKSVLVFLVTLLPPHSSPVSEFAPMLNLFRLYFQNNYNWWGPAKCACLMREFQIFKHKKRMVQCRKY